MPKPLFIACSGRKGGVAKTTSALCLASMFLRKDSRVLMIDLDPQGSASVVLGIQPHASQAAALLRGDDWHPQAVLDEFDILTGGSGLEDLSGGVGQLSIPEMDGLGYDVIIADCPPGSSQIDRPALRAAHVVLVCCEAHRLAVAGAARVLGEITAYSPRPRSAVLLTRLDRRRGLDRTAPEILQGAFPDSPLFPIRQDSALANALNSGMLPGPSGRGWDDYQDVFHWIIEIGMR